MTTTRVDSVDPRVDRVRSHLRTTVSADVHPGTLPAVTAALLRGSTDHMGSQQTGTRSTGAEAPAEAATDAPTGAPAQPHPTLPDGFTELDRRAIDTARVLAMDAVQKVGNGHPGTAMSMAPT